MQRAICRSTFRFFALACIATMLTRKITETSKIKQIVLGRSIVHDAPI